MLVFVFDRVQCGNRRSVPQVRLGKVDDDVFGIVRVVKLGVEVIRGCPEQFPDHRVVGGRIVALAGDIALDGRKW